MTLLDLLNLLKPHVKKMLIVSIVCGLAVLAGSYVLIHNSYQATSTIVVNTGAASVKGFADNAAAAGYDGVTLTTAVTTANNSVTITAKGRNAADCVAAANEVVAETKRVTEANISGVTTNVSEASSAKDVTPKRYTYAIVAFLAVLFVFIAWYVCLDMLKRRIHSRDALQEALDAPCLGELGGTDAEQERLLATARLVGRDGQAAATSICLIPVGDVDTASHAASQLRASSGDAGMRIFATKPLSAGAEALMSARGVDTVLLAVQQEQSTYTDAETLVRELELVGVKPAGFVYEAPSQARKQKSGDKKPKKKGGKHS